MHRQLAHLEHGARHTHAAAGGHGRLIQPHSLAAAAAPAPHGSGGRAFWTGLE